MSRTGELCPACKEGHLKPTGQKMWVRMEGKDQPVQELAGYECDKCGVLHAEFKATFGVGFTGRPS